MDTGALPKHLQQENSNSIALFFNDAEFESQTLTLLQTEAAMLRELRETRL